MKHIKKVIAIVGTLAMITSLCGCKGKEIQDGASTTVSEDAVSENDVSEGETFEKEEIVVNPYANLSEDEIPALRDCMADTGIFAGCAVTGSEADDEKVWNIITKHFSNVTLGNELKPDCIFNYSNAACPGKETVVLNGEEMEVPKTSFAKAEKILDKIYDWNQANPDKQIKVRGHVLVWHSQTPEWFFHEEYDKSKAYVDKETMNKRLEWYISTVLTHFLGEDSKYKGMFYGWDVVNEAISDGKGGLDGIRTDAENGSELLTQDTHGSNSSWYHIYGSNEYIINAFKYANKYAPVELELYYNDYNECNAAKSINIQKLLRAIKDEEGEPGVGTRISAMGMQGHYDMTSPDMAAIQSCIKHYCDIVGKVQLTEVDIKASSDYDGSDESKAAENEALRIRYNIIRTSLVGANKLGMNVEGITFWGTVDHYSWLQSRSNVGGGNTSGLSCMPLLFDEDYMPKPAFFVFATTDK